MENKQVIEALQTLRKEAKKRNFSQTFDLLITLRNLDLKKAEHKVELFVTMPHKRGKQVKVCALVGGSLYNNAKEHADLAIVDEDFATFVKNKKEVKKIVREHDFFVAQADIMPKVATSFGRFLGPKAKMPNPKAGGIIPPKGNVKPVMERMQKTVRVSVKTELNVKCPVGKEDMSDEDIAANIMAVHSAVLNAMPQHEQNIKGVFVKFTMSKAVQIGGKK